MTHAVRKLLGWTCVPAQSYEQDTPQPPTVNFQWGNGIDFTGFLQQVQVVYTMFAPADGTPLRAIATISLHSIPDDPQGTNPTSGGISGRRSALLEDCDGLAAIAYREYGDPGLWRGIAIANGIEDPARIPVGSRLLVPRARRPPSSAGPEVSRPMAADQSPYGSRPQITVDGAPLSPDVAPALARVVVHAHVHLPGMFALHFQDTDRTVLSRARIRFGSKVTVAASATGTGALTALLVGEVTALEQESDTTGTWTVVRGYDPLHRLCRGRRTRTFSGATDADIVRQIAADSQLDLGDVDPGGPVYDHVSQANLTDWEFLRGRAHETGHELAVSDGTLYWRVPPGQRRGPGRRRRPGCARPARPVPAGRQPAPVPAPGHRRRAGERGPGARLGPGRQAAGTGQRARRGVEHQRRGLARRPGQRVRRAPLRGRGPAGHQPGRGRHGGRRGRRADRRGARRGRGHRARRIPGSCPAPRSASRCAGWPHDGSYVLTSARHCYDEAGYRTEFTVSGRQERSLLGLASAGVTKGSQRACGPPVYGLVVGQVTDIADPDGMFRVKVSLPWLSDDYESWWARVAQPGAGSGRGLAWLPEVGDEVLVAFGHGDVRAPYVIGGLYNGVDTPPLGGQLVDTPRARWCAGRASPAPATGWCSATTTPPRRCCSPPATAT